MYRHGGGCVQGGSVSCTGSLLVEYRATRTKKTPISTSHICHSDQQIVVLSEILEHEANLGYELFHRQHLLKFNGQAIQNLAHLAQMVDECRTGQMVFEFDRCVCFWVVFLKGGCPSVSVFSPLTIHHRYIHTGMRSWCWTPRPRTAPRRRWRPRTASPPAGAPIWPCPRREHREDGDGVGFRGLWGFCDSRNGDEERASERASE